MKIIHCADIHLGSKIESKFTPEITEKRKKEILATFSRMVEYAKENDIKVIILSGDVFDKDKPAIKDKEIFYKTISKNPDIDFIYLRGNHDLFGGYEQNDIPNLKVFNADEVTTYSYDDVDISGIEMTPETFRTIYGKINLDKTKLNILMLHGDDSDTVGLNKIRIENLKNKGIDYLALGHYHTYKIGKIDDRGIYAFSGCLEGRGFDECGEKGFIVLDINDGKINHTFVPFAFRTLHEIDVDVTGMQDLVEVSEAVKAAIANLPSKDIARINLAGELPVEADITSEDVRLRVNDKLFFVVVKNKTNTLIRLEDYAEDNSLIGEFVRGVYNNPDYNEEMRQKILNIGIKLFNGRGIEK